MAPVLDQVNQAFLNDPANSHALQLYQLGYEEARLVIENLQRHKQAPDVTAERIDLPVGPTGKVTVVLYKPADASGDLPLAFYFHGGGWSLGSPKTHGELVSDLVRESGSAIVFVCYSPSPEKQYPVQFEESYAVINDIVRNNSIKGLKTDRIALIGDSAGGHMAIAMSTLAGRRSLPTKIAYQALFYPITNLASESPTFATFKDGPWLTVARLKWMEQAFMPNQDDRLSVLGSPVNMDREQASTQPPTLIITAAVDPVQAEGEDFGSTLERAGIEVGMFRAEGQIHDFAVLKPVRKSATAVAAVQLAALKIKKALA